MNSKNNYKPFNRYVLRTPLLPIDFKSKILFGKTITDEQLKDILEDKIVQESIFLASPILLEQVIKWLNNEIKSIVKIEKLKISVLKYISRMSSRCTPFGLFAGCSVGEFSNLTNIKLNNSELNHRHTRFDMNYLVALTQRIIKIPFIQNQLLFFVNSSLYEIGDKLRFVEYYYVGGKRNHQIVEIDKLLYLSKIISFSKNGAYKNDLITLLQEEGVSTTEAEEFITEIINSQILICELEPSVSGDEFFKQILFKLEKTQDTESLVKTLKDLDNKMTILDEKIGNDIEIYKEIIDLINKLPTDYDPKYMFQTDLILNPLTNTVSISIVNDVTKALNVINKLTPLSSNTNLTEFKKAFYKRYEEQEVDLAKVLDTDLGIGYKQNSQSQGDLNPLIDDIVLPYRGNSFINIQWNSTYQLFYRKLIDAYKNNSSVIQIDDEDLEIYEENWNDLPDTISVMTELIKNSEGEDMIFVVPMNGTSAANIFGRFCHGDKKIFDYTEEIINTETNINQGKLCAEIVHLPQARIGNIIMRPHLRGYEIPYLGKSNLAIENQLPINDLVISIKNNRLILKSKRYNKEVIPYLTNAHNYSFDSLPIYNFLCEFQEQDKRPGLYLNIIPRELENEFIPRVQYKNIILSKATWNLKKIDVKHLLEIDDSTELMVEIERFLKIKSIPQFVVLSEGDNELFVNFGNILSVKMFLDTIKKRVTFKLLEFLFSNESPVKNNNDNYYSNQVILSYFNETKLVNK